jgi:hypothetical protein
MADAQTAREAAAQPRRGAAELPPNRTDCRRFDASVGGHHVDLEVGEYPDGRPCAIRINLHKEGSDYRGVMEAFARTVTYGLQHGVPLAVFVDDWIGCRFAPAGMTDDPDVRAASSILDWIGRKLAIEYPGHARVCEAEAAE